MNHDPNNRNCDKTQYGDAEDVRCTCDIDSPEDGGPSIVMADPNATDNGYALRDDRSRAMRAARAARAVEDRAGTVTLTGRQATTHNELRAAGLEVKAAEEAYRQAQARWKAALDAHMSEVLT